MEKCESILIRVSPRFARKVLVAMIVCSLVLLTLWNWRLVNVVWKPVERRNNQMEVVEDDDIVVRNEVEEFLPEKVKILRRIQHKVMESMVQNKINAVDIWLKNGNVAYDDPLLVEYIKRNYLIPPDLTKPYALEQNVENPSEGQIQAVWDILKDIRDPFFVDCGAHDGEFLSNSLWLEAVQKWNGLLIEASPGTFTKLRSKNRKAWHANLCLSRTKSPRMTSFFQNPGNPGQNGLNKRAGHGVTQEIKVLCVPLYTVLLALNRTVIDFFSLDIEGLELEVLKTIPFDKVLIKTLAIEHWSIPGGAAVLEEFMKGKGYKLIELISTRLSRDSIFVHNSVHRQTQTSQ